MPGCKDKDSGLVSRKRLSRLRLWGLLGLAALTALWRRFFAIGLVENQAVMQAYLLAIDIGSVAASEF